MMSLVGRHDLIGRIDALVAAAQTRNPGRSSALTLAGDPGSGRTALLSVAGDMAGARGMRVLRTSGVDIESSEPYASLQEMLLPIAFDGSHTLRERSSDDEPSALRVAIGLEGGPSPHLHHVVDETIGLLTGLLADTPVLLLLDDLDRMDRSSADVFDAIAGRTLPGLAVIGTILTGGRGLAGVPPRIVGALDDDESARLLDTKFPELSTGVRRRFVEVSLGNPLTLSEFPEVLTDAQRRDDDLDVVGLDWTPRLRREIAGRIAGVSLDTRRLLLLHVLEPTRPLVDFAVALKSHDALLAAIPAIDLGLVTVADNASGQVTMNLANPRLRALLVAAVTSDEWAALHRALGAVLAADPEYVESIAAEPDPDAPDLRRSSLLVGAAEAALLAGDWRACIDRLDRAVELTPSATVRASRLARAAYLAASVDMPLAARLVERMRREDPAVTTSLHGAIAMAAVLTRGEVTDIDMAHRLLREAIDDTGSDSHPDPDVLWEAIGELRWASWLGGRAELWAAYRRTADHWGLESSVLGATLWAGPSGAMSVEQRESAIAVIDQHHDPRWTILVAEAAASASALHHCAEALGRIIDQARRTGPVMPGVWASMLLADDDCERGDFAQAIARVEDARTWWGAAGFGLLGWAADALLARIAASRGDSAALASLTGRVTRWAVARRSQTVQVIAARADLMLSLSQGNSDRALERSVLINPVGELGDHPLVSPAVALDTVAAAVQSGRADLARAYVDSMARTEFGLISPRHKVIHLVAQALVSSDAQARTLYRAALSVPDVDRWRVDRARVQLLYGSHLRRTHSITQSRHPLAQALATFSELGCREWAERARTELAAAGSADMVGEVRSSRLTPREHKIAEAAATGMSNKMIGVQLGISPRTVGNHLHRIFVKLEIGSRGALRDTLNASGTGST